MSQDDEIKNEQEVTRKYLREPQVPVNEIPAIDTFQSENGGEIRSQVDTPDAPEKVQQANLEATLEQGFPVMAVSVSGFPVSEEQQGIEVGVEHGPNSPLNLVMTSEELSEMGRHQAPYLVEGIVPEECLLVAGGDAKAGKTHHAVHLSLEITRGGTLYGRYQARQGKVVYINLEIAAATFGKRYNEACAGLGMSPINPNFVSVSDMDLNLREEASLIDLELIISAHKPALVVIDTLAAAAHFSENNDMQVKQIFKALKAISHRQKTAILLLAHHGKKNKALTGHASMLAVPDAIFAIHRLKNGRSIFEIVNNRHLNNEGDSVEVQLVTEEGMTRLEVIPQDGRTVGAHWKGAEVARPNIEAIILGAFVDGQWRQRAGIEVVCRLQGVMPKEMDPALKAMAADGRLEKDHDPAQTGRGQRRHIYRLSTADQQLVLDGNNEDGAEV